MFDFEDVRCRCSPSGSKALGSVSIPVEMGDGEKKETQVGRPTGSSSTVDVADQ